MITNGIIKDYAIGGAVAVMAHTEPFETEDIDIFVIIEQVPKLGTIDVSNIYKYVESLGYKRNKNGYYVIGGFSIHFVPLLDELIEEAIKKSCIRKYKEFPVRVFCPEYLIAILLMSFRMEDFIKIKRLLTQSNLNHGLVNDLLDRFNLRKRLHKFEKIDSGHI